jgi:outer membrane biosynthesis protein TonB
VRKDYSFLILAVFLAQVSLSAEPNKEDCRDIYTKDPKSKFYNYCKNLIYPERGELADDVPEAPTPKPAQRVEPETVEENTIEPKTVWPITTEPAPPPPKRTILKKTVPKKIAPTKEANRKVVPEPTLAPRKSVLPR